MSDLRKQAAQNFAKPPKHDTTATKDVARIGAGYGIELASVPLLVPPGTGKRRKKIRGLQLERRFARLGRDIENLPSNALKKIKALPSYAWNNPAKFSAGVGLKVLGGMVALKGLAGLAEKAERAKKHK